MAKYIRNGPEDDVEGAYIYDFALDYLESICEIAKAIQCYDILGAAYFEMARINYYNYLDLGDQSLLEEFDRNLRLYSNITGKENGISQREYEMYFEVRSSGKYLDLYITEMETMLSELSFSDNPSFYAFSKWELGKHYYYKALELRENYSNNDELNRQLFWQWTVLIMLFYFSMKLLIQEFLMRFVL